MLPTPVNADPSPTNDVAVHTPVKNPSPSGLSVIPDPTRVLDLNVAIPATSRIPVLTFAVLPTPVNADPSIAGSVPVKFAAGKLVKFAPLAGGSVAGNLAFGSVPEPSSDAFKVVKFAPLPTKFDAVTTPTTFNPDSLAVTAEPTAM